MKKENTLITGNGEPTTRITRARAAACRLTGGMLPLKPSSTKEPKRVLRGNSKRTAMGSNANTDSVTVSLQHKRRAVLADVTNVCCDGSYKNYINLTKIQAKDCKRSKQGTSKDSKVTPVVAVEPVAAQDNTMDNIAEEISEKERSKPQEARPSFLAESQKKIVTQECLQSITNEESIIASCAVNSLLEKPNLKKPSETIIPSIKDEEKLCKDLGSGSSNSLDIMDIDSDHKNILLCSLYAGDIYMNLCVTELIRRPCLDFMERLQQDITQSMRGILIDWLVEVSEEYKLVPDTLYLTVYFIDRFLSQNFIERKKLQLLGITCMLIASKYEEICAPRVEEFCFMTDNTYTREEVLKMEGQVLDYLGFQLSAPTAKTFLRRFIRAAQICFKVPVPALEFLANYLAELTLVDYEFLKFLPSLIAASAVFLARWTLDQSSHPWNSTLEHYTSYKALDLKHAVFAMQELQMNSKGCPLNAIREKYKQQKFKSVAALSSPKLFETLF